MNKILILISLFSIKLYGQQITARPEVPVEIKMMTDCLPNIEKTEAKGFVEKFNNAFNKINSGSLKIFTKTEFYKFLLNFEGINANSKSKDVSKSLKNLIQKKNRLCRFEQWLVYAIQTDLKKLSSKTSPGYKRKLEFYSENWVFFLEKMIEDRDYEMRARYFQFLVFLAERASIFSLTDDDLKYTFLSIQETPKSESQSKKESIDKLFKEKTNTDSES